MQPITDRRWTERAEAPDRATVRSLAEALKLHPLTASVLARRGYIEPQAARAFLDARLQDLPDPLLLRGMETAAARIGRAVTSGEQLSVHGDYDVDGISATALLVEGLRALGAQVEFFIPLRLRDGYGLSGDDLQRAVAQGATVAITVDCGISALAEAELARSLGLDLIITDHHHPPEQLPAAFAIVNPHLPDCRYPFKALAGVGVAFMVLIALRKWLREQGFFAERPEPDLRYGLDLVALGTIADIVPLVGVNRILTRLGLSIINQGKRPGLKALCDVAGVREASCGTVAFGLAPRLNAAGRLEDAALGIEMLLANDYGRAHEQALLLDQFNRERQALEQQTFSEAVVLLEEGSWAGEVSIVLADERWHSGVIGIVASRLVERYHRPVILIALENGKGKGSARSISGLHLYEALQTCSEHLLGYGGHAYAAGLSLDASRLADFAEAFEAAVREVLGEKPHSPVLGYDGEVLIEELTLAALDDLERLAPFGAANPEPLFVVRGARAQQVVPCGEKHLRFSVRQGGFSLPCIAFNLAARRNELLAGEIDLLVVPQKNEWQGRTTLQLRIKDLRVAVVGADA